MRTIYKYPLKLVASQVVQMPESSIILDIQVQDGGLCLWAIVDTEKPMASREIWLFGTGHQLLTDFKNYIATVQLGSFVWHLFDMGEK